MSFARKFGDKIWQNKLWIMKQKQEYAANAASKRVVQKPLRFDWKENSSYNYFSR